MDLGSCTNTDTNRHRLNIFLSTFLFSLLLASVGFLLAVFGLR